MWQTADLRCLVAAAFPSAFLFPRSVAVSRSVCPRCARPRPLCLCPLIPSLSSRTRVLVLQHPFESRHALNTARLAVLGLERARLLVGAQFGPQAWEAPGLRSVLLFPGESSQPLAAASGDGPLQLIVLDGTWKQARKMLRDNPELAALPRAHPPMEPAGAASRYRVRHADLPGALSSIEAIVRALNVLEAPAAYDALLRPFEALVDAQIRAMGQDTYERHHLRRSPGRKGRQA